MPKINNKIQINSYIISYTSILVQLIWWIKIYNAYPIRLYKYIFIIITPLYILTTAFFIFYVVNMCYNIVVPKKWLEQDSKYITYFRPVYKGIEGDEIGELDEVVEINEILELEHIEVGIVPITTILTIQIPVYLESFHETLLPTYNNVLRYIRQYNSHSLSQYKINLLVCEDGYIHLSEEERLERLQYYEQQEELYFIARPKKGRNGRFKKASNMNFSLKQIFHIDNNNTASWSNLAIKHNFVCNSNISTFELGKYILLLDSDSKIQLTYDNINCLINEFEMNPKIGFLQLRTRAEISSPMNKWENTIGYFTNNIYDINFFYSCSNGFPAPLVGHNCMLNVDVMKKVFEKNHGKKDTSYQIWDENRVSEDFIFSLQCQYIGYYGKYIYWDCGMTEGVTLNVLDEITKMEKYAFGVNELLFNPINQWWTNGFLTEVFIDFILTNGISIPAKYAIVAYIGSYYALALSPIVTLINYISTYIYHIINISSTDNEFYIKVYINDPIYIIYSCFFIFFVLSFIANTITKWKHKIHTEKGLIYFLYYEMYHGLRLCLFFSGLSYHLLVVILQHFLSHNVSWKMTNKETQAVSYKTIILEKYPIMYSIGSVVFFIIVVGYNLPDPYENKDIYSIIPLVSFIVCSLTTPFIS